MVFEGTATNSTSGATNTEVLTWVNTFANGTGADQAQRMWVSEGRTLSASATEDLDMFDLASFDIGGGAGKDGLGLAHAITGVKFWSVRNRSTSAGNLSIGNKAATTAWQSPFVGSGDADAVAIVLVPGAWVTMCVPTAAGLAVADSSNHLFKFLDAGSGCTFDVAFIGI
jgi:hypothetical protein